MTKRAAAPDEVEASGVERLGETLGFMRLLWVLDHSLHSASKRMNTELGVTGPQRLVIRVVGRVPDITAGGVSGLLQVDPSTLTGVFHRLVRKGYLRRERDKRDGRVAHFRLTPKGARVDRALAGTVEAAIRKALSGQPRMDVAAAQRVLRALGESLQENG